MIGIIVTLVVLGVILYVINRFVPMDPKINKIMNIAVVVIVVLWLLSVFGILSYVDRVTVPRIR